ncbi:MAG: hypothetical protein CMH83_03075 [Nocardioides sp.]|nr:hypothetical protein [Nocardioides sp.]
MRVVLLGDSHLARVRRESGRLGRDVSDVVNAAVGGARCDQVADQAARAGVGPADVVVLSIGTNDAAPWKQVPLTIFRATLRGLLVEVPARAWVLVSAPGVDADRLSGEGDRTEEVVARYRDAAAEVLGGAGAVVIDSPALLAPLGPAETFLDDGLHLTPAAYDVLLPAVADAVAATV